MFRHHFKHSENRSRILILIDDEKCRLNKNFDRNQEIGTSNQENVIELEHSLDNFEN